MAQRSYITFNLYGSPTSRGFDDTWSAMAFDSKRQRAAYIADMGSSDRSIRPCSAKEARKHTQSSGGVRHLRLFDPGLGERLCPSDYFERRL